MVSFSDVYHNHKPGTYVHRDNYPSHPTSSSHIPVGARRISVSEMPSSKSGMGRTRDRTGSRGEESNDGLQPHRKSSGDISSDEHAIVEDSRQQLQVPTEHDMPDSKPVGAEPTRRRSSVLDEIKTGMKKIF